MVRIWQEIAGTPSATGLQTQGICGSTGRRGSADRGISDCTIGWKWCSYNRQQLLKLFQKACLPPYDFFALPIQDRTNRLLSISGNCSCLPDLGGPLYGEGITFRL